MALTAKKLVRVFRYNGMDLPDPAPDQPTKKVLEALSLTYPELASVKLQPPEQDGNTQVFRINVVAGYKG